VVVLSVTVVSRLFFGFCQLGVEMLKNVIVVFLPLKTRIWYVGFCVFLGKSYIEEVLLLFQSRVGF
jgi:hypothetical protein